MANGDVPDSLSEHFDAIMKFMQYILVGLISWFAYRLNVFNKEHKKILKVIPQEAFDEGFPLMTCRDCTRLRKECQNIVITEELIESMKVIKKAIMVLVLHTDGIPKDDKEKIAKDLV